MDDLISREDALLCLTGKYTEEDYKIDEYVAKFAKRIRELPSAEKTGRWYVRETYPLESHGWECSECQEIIFAEETNYCPNCGARMEGET